MEYKPLKEAYMFISYALEPPHTRPLKSYRGGPYKAQLKRQCEEKCARKYPSKKPFDKCVQKYC